MEINRGGALLGEQQLVALTASCKGLKTRRMRQEEIDASLWRHRQLLQTMGH